MQTSVFPFRAALYIRLPLGKTLFHIYTPRELYSLAMVNSVFFFFWSTMGLIYAVTYVSSGEESLEACLVWVMDFVACNDVRSKTQKNMPAHWSRDSGYDQHYSKVTSDSDSHWFPSLMMLWIPEVAEWDKLWNTPYFLFLKNSSSRVSLRDQGLIIFCSSEEIPQQYAVSDHALWADMRLYDDCVTGEEPTEK